MLRKYSFHVRRLLYETSVLCRLDEISELNQALLNSIKTLLSQTKDEGETKSVTHKKDACLSFKQV